VLLHCLQVPTTPAPARGVSLIMNAGTINVNDFKTGVTIEIDQQPYRVLGEAKQVCCT
jgi:hypothetical protein